MFAISHGENESMFDLTFEQDVEVLEYFYPEFSISTFLSNLGGTLGLWLGVGVLQVGGYGALLLGHFKSPVERLKSILL